MVGFMEAQFMGLDEQDVADLNAALPALEEAIEIANIEWPRIAPLVPTLLANISREWPKVAPHVPALLRIARKVIAKQREL